MLTGLLPTLGFIAAFAGYAVWMSKKRAQNQVVASQSFVGFMQQTGYRVAGAAEAPVEEHARKALAAVAAMGGPEGQEWVRDCGGVEVRHFFRAVTKNNQTYYWCRWTAPLPRPPRFGLQIVDRRLVGAVGKLDNFVENRSYEWKKQFPHVVQVGDPELDARFLFLGDNPELLVRALRTAGLREMLLACTQVDIWTDAKSVNFSDPFRENLKAAYGGGMGLLAAGYDPNAIVAAILPVHDRIGWLVAGLARACV